MNPKFEDDFIASLNLITSTRCTSDLNSSNNNAYQNMSNNLSIQNMDQATSLQSEADSAISSQKSTEREVKRKIIKHFVYVRMIKSK